MKGLLETITKDRVISSVFLDYLPTISQMALKRVLKADLPIYPRFRQRCAIFLTKVAKIDGNMFMNYVEQQELTLSGGFILSVLLWDNFEHLKDIDVYIPHKRSYDGSSNQIAIWRCYDIYQELDKVIPLSRDCCGH